RKTTLATEHPPLEPTDEVCEPLLSEELRLEDLDRETLDRLAGDVVVRAGHAAALGPRQTAVEVLLVRLGADEMHAAEPASENPRYEIRGPAAVRHPDGAELRLDLGGDVWRDEGRMVVVGGRSMCPLAIFLT